MQKKKANENFITKSKVLSGQTKQLECNRDYR